MGLWWYNNFRRHWNNWRFWLCYRGQWIAEGREPKLFPRFGRITQADIAWADEELE